MNCVHDLDWHDYFDEQRGYYMKKLFLVAMVACVTTLGGWANAASVKNISEDYTDWSVMNGEGKPARYNAITTSTDNEGYLVYSCHVKGSCFLTMLVTATCEIGASYPMLMNSDSGASSVQTTCVDIHTDLGAAEYQIEDPDAVLAETVFNDMRVGIAIPMADGKFKAVRFSLLGSQEAMARVIQLANTIGSKAVESGEF
jgi:hypothetical protein